MKRIYHPYWLWEDHQNGLYDLEKVYTEEQIGEMALSAKELLSDSERFRETALKVILEWRHSAQVNLTNTSRNREAWIGQASCCYALKIPEYITKFGWRLMTPEQQKEANRIADLVIEEWEVHHAKKILGQKCL